MQKIKIGLCDDMQPYCHYLERRFSRESDIEVVGIVDSAKSCLEMVKEKKPDILLLDVQMEKFDSGTEIIPDIKESSPDTKIIMLTVHREEDQIFNAFVHGAIDYLYKSSTDEEILQLIRKVYYSQTSLSPKITQALRNEGSKLKEQNEKLLDIINIVAKLTTSEFSILNDLYLGLSYGDIAKKRFVEEITIRSQISRILKKFGKTKIADVTKLLKELKFFDIVDV